MMSHYNYIKMNINGRTFIFQAVIFLAWFKLATSNVGSCIDDVDKQEFCSLLAKLISTGEPHKCHYILEGRETTNYLGDRDCKRTCRTCPELLANEENVRQAFEVSSLADIFMNDTSFYQPSNAPSYNPTSTSYTISSTPSLAESNALTTKISEIESSSPTLALCKEKEEDMEFCGMIARLLIRGKNRCYKLMFDQKSGIGRQGSINCPITCGTCFNSESLTVTKTNDLFDLLPSSVPTLSPSETNSNYPTKSPVNTSMSPTSCSIHELKSVDSIKLYKGSFICSPDNRFVFGLSDEGDVVIRNRLEVLSNPIWFLGFHIENDDAFLVFQSDGNLVLYEEKGSSVWSSNTDGRGGDVLFLNNFGDVVIGSDKGKNLWSTSNNAANGCSGFPYLLRESYLLPGQFVCSGDEDTKFGLDYYGDLALWENGVKIWSADTGEGVLMNSNDSYMIFDSYAGLEVENFGVSVWWFINDYDYNDRYLIMTENGEVMITSVFGEDPIWTTGSSKCSRIMRAGTRLFNNQFICSRDNSYHFGLLDGELCLLYHSTKVWSSKSKNGFYIVMQSGDGNLVVRDYEKDSVWDSDTSSSRNDGSFAVIQDDGRVMIINQDDDILWSIEPNNSFLNYTTIPSPSPTLPNPPSTNEDKTYINRKMTYLPGELTVYENGLLLSTGLTSKIVASSNQFVSLSSGSQSTEKFHIRPDGASVFSTDGGWIYISNSEANLEEHDTDGGVGALHFNGDGNVTSYDRLLRGTRNNCSGGKSPWNTWLSCEEFDGGAVYEVDPTNRNPPNRTVVGGKIGGKFESVAYDIRQFPNIYFFITEDHEYGPTRRFVPNATIVENAYITKQYDTILTEEGIIDYLVLDPLSQGHGNFRFTSNLDSARKNAHKYYRNCEGIDVRINKMYMTCKAKKLLFIFDLDNGTYESSSTQSGAFEGQPDQIARLTDSNSEIIYFCEDSQKVAAGIHGRNKSGQYFTIIEAIDYDSETTGLAFSPDNRHLYFSVQVNPGIVVDVTRIDGLPFDGATIDIRYHKSVQDV